jgi:ABC-type bacteriocin/lantibiotic exporter with double-glycine peptidase domain
MNLPLYHQEQPHTCLPACIRIVLAYKGKEHTEAELAEVCGSVPIWGTLSSEAVDGLEGLGYQALWFENADLERLLELLAQDWPVIVFLRAADLPHGRVGLHAVVVAGLEAEHIVCVEPALGIETKFALKDFLHSWSVLGNQGMVVWLPSSASE